MNEILLAFGGLIGLALVAFGTSAPELFVSTGLWPLMGARVRLGRFEGVLILTVYGIYLRWLVQTV